MNRNQVYGEMKQLLGLVPTFFKKVPDNTLELEWQLFKRIQLEEGVIPGKYKELMGLAVAAATHCRYCTLFHTEAAKLNGATETEIEEALHYAKTSIGWSLYVNGLQVDYEQFKKEVVQICEHLRSTHAVHV